MKRIYVNGNSIGKSVGICIGCGEHVGGERIELGCKCGGKEVLIKGKFIGIGDHHIKIDGNEYIKLGYGVK